MEDVNHVQNKEDVWREAKNCLFRLVSRVLPALRHQRAGRGSSRGLTHDTQRFNFSPKYKICARARTNIWGSSKDGSSSCRCTTTLTGTRNARKRYANNTQTCVAANAKVSLEGRWTFLRPGEEEQLVWEPLLQATWEVQLRRSGHDVHLRRTRTSQYSGVQAHSEGVH